MIRNQRDSLTFTALAIVTALSLGACTKKDGGGGDNGPKIDSSLPSCAGIITQESMDAYMKTSKIPGLGNLIGQDPIHCEDQVVVKGKVVNRVVDGYASMLAVPALHLSNQAWRDYASQSGKYAYKINAEFGPLTPDDLYNIGRDFPDAEKRPAKVLAQRPGWHTVMIADLPRVDFDVNTPPNSVMPDQVVISLIVPYDLDTQYQAAIDDYAAGNAKLMIYDWSTDAQGRILTTSGKAGDYIRTFDFKRTSPKDYVLELWRRVASKPEFLASSRIPYEWMGDAMRALPQLGMTVQEARMQWWDALRLADKLWNPRQKQTDTMGEANAITALRFLLMLDPGNPANVYGAYLKKLDPYLGNSDRDMYRELKSFVEDKIYTPEAEAQIFALAERLTKSFGTASNPWNNAKTLLAKTKDPALIDFAIEVSAWDGRYEGQYGFGKALKWVIDDKMTRDQFTLVKDYFDFLALELQPKQAYDQAVEEVIENKTERPVLEAFVAAYQFLKTTDQAAKAFEKADTYVTKLSPASVRALIDAYTWLKTTSESANALTKAEGYMLTSGLTPEQVALMIDLEGFFRVTTDASQSVAKAEEFVITYKFNRERADLLIDAYRWLTEVFPDSTSMAYFKARHYILDRLLSRDKYLRLVDAYEKRKAEGVAEPLSKAELDVGVTTPY